jgi:hypothetical protein
MPSPEYFNKEVEKMIGQYGISNCVYENCVNEFVQIKPLSLLEKRHETRILKPFLHTWGQMQRWLGDPGVTKVYMELKKKAYADRIEPLRQINLLSIELEDLRKPIVELFNELMNTEFTTEKRIKKKVRKRVKSVGSTTASKILHLCCPNLFVMWDTAIRKGNDLDDDGESYFNFLLRMKGIWNNLSNTIERLKEKHHVRQTRIIDLYNWGKNHRNTC